MGSAGQEEVGWGMVGGGGGSCSRSPVIKDLRLSGSQEMNEQLLLADITQRSEDVRGPNLQRG